MSRATPQMRNFALRLLAYETKEGKSLETKNPVAFRVCEKLRPQLATLTGHAGFRALLARALALATQEVPWLCAMHVKPDGSLAGLGTPAAQVESREMVEGGVVLLAQLLGLLVAFIGEDLTIRLALAAWPEAPFNDFDLG